MASNEQNARDIVNNLLDEHSVSSPFMSRERLVERIIDSLAEVELITPDEKRQ